MQTGPALARVSGAFYLAGERTEDGEALQTRRMALILKQLMKGAGPGEDRYRSHLDLCQG